MYPVGSRQKGHGGKVCASRSMPPSIYLSWHSLHTTLPQQRVTVALPSPGPLRAGPSGSVSRTSMQIGQVTSGGEVGGRAVRAAVASQAAEREAGGA